MTTENFPFSILVFFPYDKVFLNNQEMKIIFRSLTKIMALAIGPEE